MKSVMIGTKNKCVFISTLVIALFRTSGFTMILICKFWPQRKSHLLWRQPDPTWFVCHLLIDHHDFSYLLHQHCRVTSLRNIQFPCISWIGIGENYALRSLTFGLHLLPTPESSECVSHTEVWNAVAPGRADFFGHLLLLKLGFSTKLHWQSLHLTRFCGLCHHPPLSNSGNMSGHHLAGSNKTGCWSSFISFVTSFSSVQFCHPCHLSSYSRWLCPLIWTWNSTMLSSPSPASCGLINHRAFFTDFTKRPFMLCVFTAKRAPSGIRLGATWRFSLMILLTSAFCCVVCSLTWQCLCHKRGLIQNRLHWLN